jgi:predicted MPP superfamily phosphohydrolase
MLWGILVPVVGWIALAAVIWVGHGVILTWTHNFFYGRVHSRWLADFFQLLHGLLLVLPPFLWACLGPSFYQGEWDTPWGRVAIAHGIICLFALPVLLLVTWRRRARVNPPGVRLENRERLDPDECPKARLGGAGLRNWLAHLKFNETLHPEIVEYSLELPNLPPAWDGLRLMHLSDLHFHGTPEREWYQWVLEQGMRREPDLVVCTGDLVDGTHFHQWIGGTLGRLKWREHALVVLGNHDSWYGPDSLRKDLKRLGFKDLGNRWQVIQVRGEPMVVGGIESPWFAGEPNLEDAPAGIFRLLLSHTPDHLAWAARHKVDLMFAGHVHGGQVCLPVFGPLVMPSRHGRSLDRGWFQQGKTQLYVSKGLGGTHPVRWNCPPEVMLLTLRTGGMKP